MVRIGENDIAVTDTGGDKPALMLVHGILMDRSVWEKQIASFSDSHRVVAMDLRGFGESRTDTADISFEDHAADLAALVEELGLRAVTYVGWSMGGAIAQIFAPAHGNTIDRLVLVDTTPQLLADDNFEHALPVEAAQQLGGLLAEDFAEGCRAFCGMVAPENPQIADRLATIATGTRPDVALAAFQSSGGRNQIAELSRISTPTWIIHGTEDAICMPAAAEFMAERIPGCNTPPTFIEGAGHAPFLTRQEVFDAELRSILGQAGS